MFAVCEFGGGHIHSRLLRDPPGNRTQHRFPTGPENGRRYQREARLERRSIWTVAGMALSLTEIKCGRPRGSHFLLQRSSTSYLARLILQYTNLFLICVIYRLVCHSRPFSTPRRREYAPEFNRHCLVQVKFRDRLGRLCSLGEGFPTDVPTVMLGGATPAERIGELSRMDLDQKQIEYLLPFLHHFVETGKLPGPESGKPEEFARPVTSQ